MPRTEIHIYDLFTLFKQIERGDLRFPSFQRKFVWAKKQIINLLESIYEGYPIGTLLFFRSKDRIFESSEFYPKTKKQNSSSSQEYVTEVVDGVQRLSALYNCLYVDDTEKDPSFNFGFDLRGKHFVHLKSVSRSDNIVELPSIFSSKKYIDIQVRLSQLADSETLLSEMNHLYSVFRDYKVPVIIIRDMKPDEVIEVFQRINTTGIRLSEEDISRAMRQKPRKD